MRSAKKKVLIEVRETDAAKANLSVVHCYNQTGVRYRGADGYVFNVHALCLLHQLYLVMSIILVLIPNELQYLGSLYCVARLLKHDNNFESMLTNVQLVVRNNIIIDRANWPDPSFRRRFSHYCRLCV